MTKKPHDMCKTRVMRLV